MLSILYTGVYWYRSRELVNIHIVFYHDLDLRVKVKEKSYISFIQENLIKFLV